MIRDRICYFSKTDLSVGYYLEIAERRIQEVSKGNVPTDLEGIIELWHIKRMFEDGCRLLKWTDAEFEKLKLSTSGYNAIVASFFINSLSLKSIKSQYEQLVWTYKKTFGEIIDFYKRYELISQETFREIITVDDGHLSDVLAFKGIVEHYKTIIRDVLIQNISASILLDKYVAKRDRMKAVPF